MANSPLAIHIGPGIETFGGTQTVIRRIRDFRIGADEIRVVSTYSGPHQLQNLRLLWKAVGILVRSQRRTLAHFHISNGGGWLREGALILVAHFLGLRVVAHLHGFDVPEFARRRPRFVAAILSRCDRVICLSAEAEVVLSQLLGPLTPVAVLPNPVPIDDDALSVDRVAPLALFAGTIGTRKGVDLLVDAWKLLMAEGVVGHCRIVGPTDDFFPPEIDGLCVTGPIHPDEVPKLLREARVVVLPSRSEAMPMILSEALAAGRPFVATDVGGVATITPDPEMLVPVDDVVALASAIRRYLVDATAAATAGERGREYVRQTRTPAVIDAALRSLYGGIA